MDLVVVVSTPERVGETEYTGDTVSIKESNGETILKISSTEDGETTWNLARQEMVSDIYVSE